jgi:hypothetical protein
MTGTRLLAALRVALVLALTLDAAAAYAQTTEQYRGRSLADALRMLQAKGLRIVFTSATVTADLRVDTEPRAQAPRHLLDELLAPHALEARDGPGGVLQIVRAEPSAKPARERSVESGGAIEGVVVHALTEAPLAGARVRVDGVTADLWTDVHGRFVVRTVPPGARTVHATTNGFMDGSRIVQVARGTRVRVTVSLLPAGSAHTERVTVGGSRPYRRDRGVLSETTLERGDIAPAGLVDDPIRAVHVLPRVSVADDLRSDFTVRGSPFRHVGIVVDGVATSWLHHTAVGRGTTGSLTMLASQVVDAATLRVGAYPHRFNDRLGAELEMTIREGSRERLAVRGAVGGTNASIVGEGPIGRAGGAARGSWLVSTRQSFLGWPAGRAATTRTAFGFADGLTKLVYDVRPTHKIGVTVLEGISNVDGEEHVTASVLGDGINRTTLTTVFWRSTVGRSIVVTQRAYLVKNRFWNRRSAGGDDTRGTNADIGYRADVASRVAAGLFEAGAQIGRATYSSSEARLDGGGLATVAEGSSWQRSAHAHFAWNLRSALTVSPGIRVTDSTLASKPTVARWVLAEYAFGRAWALNASAGTSAQLPDLPAYAPSVQPERATYLDAGIEHRISGTIRWQATVFDRSESAILRAPDRYPRLVNGVVMDPSIPGQHVNGLSGSSRGIELVVSRNGPGSLSGWAAYSFGKTRHVDAERGETFWADADQRHALNLAVSYRVSDRTHVGTTFRAGSGFPIAGYLTARDGVLRVGERRNEVRLPPYARFDVRGDRAFAALGRQATVFLEVANVLNRANVGLAHGTIEPSSGEAIGFTDTLLRRRASVGIIVAF